MIIHVLGLASLHERVVRAVVGIAVLLVTALHAAEAWAWARAYWLLGALPNLRSSVLFSLGAMTTYGGGDVDPADHWRLMGALEALNGIVLFGLTTAFLFSMIQEVRMAGAMNGGAGIDPTTAATPNARPHRKEPRCCSNACRPARRFPAGSRDPRMRAANGSRSTFTVTC